MSTYKGKNITKMDASPSVKIASSYVGGRLRVFYDEYDFDLPSGRPFNETVNIARLPVDAVVYGFVLAHDYLGSQISIALGDVIDTVRYMIGKFVDFEGIKTSFVDGKKDSFGYEITKETRDVNMILPSSGAYNGAVKFTMIYTLD